MNKVLALCFLFSGLFSGCNMSFKENRSDDYTNYVNQIVNSFSEKMKKEFGLDCYGSGGRMPYDVEEISIKFSAYRRATIEEARELEVKVTEEFIEAINSNEKIRPFLREYPFRADRAEIAISFKQPNHCQYTDGSVAYVFQVKNRIYYEADSETSPSLISIMDEPYEEALKIVNESSK